MADNSYNAASYSAPSYGASGGAYGAAPSNNNEDDGGGLRRRSAAAPQYGMGSGGGYGDDTKYSKTRGRGAVVEKLDFMFPKVDREFTVKTKGGGVASLVATGLVAILILAEVITWYAQNGAEVSRTYVDNSLGKKMRVNMNIVFPGLACDDLHLNVIDVAGDHQLDIQDTLKKRKLHKNGSPMTVQEMDVETNVHRKQQAEKDRVMKQKLPEDYCGPCYGAAETEGQCCQSCDELIEAYTKKKWKTDMLKFTSEQCIREGRDHQEAKKLITNQGCHLTGYMLLNRVSGNFHIAMGEGIERDGRHIQTFNPEDAPNFNASHIIHDLSFGPADGTEPLTGTTKIVTERVGTTGLFQYFIKIVPTSYVGDAFPGNPELVTESTSGEGEEKRIETNRYFITERFNPLMSEGYEDHITRVEGDSKRHAVQMNHNAKDHHMIRNSVLPGIFFIYEIYPFAVEISKNYVPFTHLLIRIMATVGGVFTLARWADSIIYDRRR